MLVTVWMPGKRRDLPRALLARRAERVKLKNCMFAVDVYEFERIVKRLKWGSVERKKGV